MRSLLKRIGNRCQVTVKNFKNDLHFSLKLAVCRFTADICGRIGLKKISKKARRTKDKIILNYLNNLLIQTVDKYKKDSDIGTVSDLSNIWVCWWTGENDAPPLVKKCIKSIRDNSANHSVVLIDQNNYSDYIEIPEYILSKVKEGKICLAHFSDYIRVSLLEKYGGLWLDATIFCSSEIPNECFSAPFFTCKSEVLKDIYISDYQWTSFCLGGYKQHIFFRFVKEALETYWQKNETAVDYLFFDYIICLAKQSIAEISRSIDAVPINNVHRDDLQAAMNEKLPAEMINSVLKNDTILYKLSWREKYDEITSDGRKSIYGAFIE